MAAKRMVLWLGLDSWNNLIVAFGVISGLFVVLTGAATYVAFQLQKAEARAAADALSQYKTEAEARIADANARSLRAQADLAKYKAPRRISREQSDKIKESVAPFAGQSYSGLVAGSVADAPALWAQIALILDGANWKLESPYGLATGKPPAGVPVRAHEGITVFLPAPHTPTAVRAAGLALSKALNDAGFESNSAEDTGPQRRPGIIVIEIGTKPG